MMIFTHKCNTSGRATLEHNTADRFGNVKGQMRQNDKACICRGRRNMLVVFYTFQQQLTYGFSNLDRVPESDSDKAFGPLQDRLKEMAVERAAARKQ